MSGKTAENPLIPDINTRKPNNILKIFIHLYIDLHFSVIILMIILQPGFAVKINIYKSIYVLNIFIKYIY